MRRHFAMGILAAVQLGCAAGPDYVAPDLPEAEFRHTDGARFAPAAPDAAWWRTFDDPVLSDLIRRAALEKAGPFDTGYFFYYGHYYAALCIEQLPQDQRPPFQAHLAGALIALQEKDGSWWDYAMWDYHKPYGTSYAVMALMRLNEAEEEVGLDISQHGEEAYASF